MIRSLKFRLGLGAIAFVGLALFFTWLALSALFTGYVMDKSRSEMLAVIDGLTTQMRISADGAPLTLVAGPVDQRYLTPAGGHYWQIAENKVAALRSASLFDGDLPVSSTGGGLDRVNGPDGEDVFTLVNEVTLSDRKFAIAAAVSAHEIETEIYGFRSELARMMGLTAIALLLAAFVQIMTGLAPLRRLGIAVLGIRDGTLTHMPDDLPEELKPLTNQLNTLLDERNLAIARAQARANDLAHGLKTPLTILGHIGERLSAGTQIGDEGYQIQEQVDMLRQRVDRQLAMARISHNNKATTQLAPLIERLVV
ncbi:MAG: sensor histidine kinase, partial [Notoacmeibacter sp.]